MPRRTQKRTREVLIDYIKNIPADADIDKFMFTFKDSKGETEVVSNLKTETIDTFTALEQGLMSADDIDVINEITDQAFDRQ